MIARTLDGVSVLPADVAARFGPDTRVDETIAVRRCALYRKAFRKSAVRYPADALRFEAVADWVRRHGVTVDVTSADEFDRVALSGVPASRIVMHCGDDNPVPIHRAVDAGVGRFVVKSTGQVAVLATSFAKRSPRVLVHAECSDELASEVAAHGRLDLIGLHCQLGAADAASLAEIVVGMIARMARISRKHGRILSRISLGGVDLTPGVADPRILRRVAEAVDQAVEDGCIRFRYARPVLTVAPCRSALLPSR